MGNVWRDVFLSEEFDFDFVKSLNYIFEIVIKSK